MTEIAKFSIALCVLGPLFAVVFLQYQERCRHRARKIIRNSVYLDQAPQNVSKRVAILVLLLLTFIGLCEVYLAYHRHSGNP